MFIHEAMRLLVINDAAVSALIASRLYAGFLSQAVTFPAVAYRQMSVEASERLEERGRTGIANFRFRFFSTASLATGGYDKAKDIADAIRLSLDGYSGTIIDSSVSPIESLEIVGAFHVSSLDGYDDQSETYQVISDYDIWAREVLAT